MGKYTFFRVRSPQRFPPTFVFLSLRVCPVKCRVRALLLQLSLLLLLTAGQEGEKSLSPRRSLQAGQLQVKTLLPEEDLEPCWWWSKLELLELSELLERGCQAKAGHVWVERLSWAWPRLRRRAPCRRWRRRWRNSGWSGMEPTLPANTEHTFSSSQSEVLHSLTCHVSYISLCVMFHVSCDCLCDCDVSRVVFPVTAE